MKFVKYLLVFLAPVVFCACPGPEKIYYQTIPDFISLDCDAKEQEKFLEIQSNENWEITVNDDWLSVFPHKHTASSKVMESTSVKIAIASNPTDTIRKCTLELKGMQSGLVYTITIKQAANEHVQYYTYVTTPEFSVGHEAGSFSLNIQSNEPWQLTTESTWCVPSDNQGEGSRIVEVSVDVNGTVTERKATINVKGSKSGATAQVTVTQSGAPVAQHISIADFLQKADTKNAYELTGTVKNITNTTYGNFDLVENGSKIYINGLLDQNGEAKHFSNMNIEDGDELTLSGVYTEYDSQPEIKNAQFVRVKKYQKPLVLSTDALAVGSGASTTQFGISSAESWTVTSNQTWCTIEPKYGSNDATVTVSVEKNTTKDNRNATITVKGDKSGTKSIVLTQKGKSGSSNFGKDEYGDDSNIDSDPNPTYTLSAGPSSLSFIAAGGKMNVEVSGNDTWSAKSNATWCTLSKTSGTGAATITVTTSKNSTTSPRTATITITGTKTGKTITISVSQNKGGSSNFGKDEYGDDSNIDSDPNPTYTLSAGPSSLSFIAAGGKLNVEVSGNDSWTASSSASWCTLSKTSGTGAATVAVTASKNGTTSPRTATITFKGNKTGKTITISVSQEKGNSSTIGKEEFGDDSDIDGNVTYSLSATPSSLSFTATGGRKNVEVSGNDSWTATSSASWCTLSKTSGTGSATVAITASKNSTTSPRTATITLKGSKTGKTITISVSQEKGNSSTIGKDDYGDDTDIDGSKEKDGTVIGKGEFE